MTVAAPVLVTSLQELCIKAAAANFETSPSFSKLSDKHVRKIISILPLDLPLELVGTLINDEDYWKRRCHARWKNMEVTAHGYSYKQLYFERNLQDAIEHVPSALTVHYNLQNVGMEYDRSLFGMKLADCRNLAKVLETNETLTYLDLSNNMLDDDKVRMLASGLVENLSVTHLNLAHNKVADRGVRALAKLLDQRSVMAILELQDNLIHTEGAKSLARALKSNQALTCLNLRLNRMGDEGIKVLCESLRGNQSVEKLNLAANSGGKSGVNALAALVRLNTTLTELDASCNGGFGAEGCEQLRRAVEANTSLIHADMRQCGAELDDEYAVAEALRVRLEKKERAKEK